MESSELTPKWPDAPEEFCAALKAARLRRGLTLAEISQKTKISESHFVALERGDLRHWPKGIFRRAFFSDYARAIGLPVQPALAAFARLFPDPGAPEEPAARTPTVAPPREKRAFGEMRLSLVRGPAIPPGALRRARLAAADAMLVIALAAAGAWMVHGDMAVIVAIVALSYYSLAAVFGRQHPGPALVRRVVDTIPALGRLRLDVSGLGGGAARLSQAIDIGRLRTEAARVVAAMRVPVRWRALDLERLKAIDLQRLKTATPRVFDRLRVRRVEGGERPMARPRIDSPRQARRRAENSSSGQDRNGVRVRIRLTR